MDGQEINNPIIFNSRSKMPFIGLFLYLKQNIEVHYVVIETCFKSTRNAADLSIVSCNSKFI